tara:strand:- start:2844 stop:3740 length:897 start_codon:yes stop_codon:yes gene_type:complete
MYTITALRKIYNTKNWIQLDYSWEQLAAFITNPRKLTKKEELPAFSPAMFSQGLKNCHVQKVSLAVFDIDEGLDFGYHRAFQDYRYIAYTSFSHSEKKHKWRLVIPFSEPVGCFANSDKWEAAWMQCKKMFFEHTGRIMDEQCKDARRFYFLPNTGSKYHVNIPSSGDGLFSIDFEAVTKYVEDKKKEQMEKLERMRNRAKSIENMPYYLQDPKEHLSIKLATEESYRVELGKKIQGRSTGGNNPRIVGWKCPNCGKSDATYFYVSPLGNRTSAQCGHLNSCGHWWTLFGLGRLFGVC